MKKRILSSLLALSLLASMVVSVAAEDAADIVILHTNDSHCAIEDGMGYAGVAAYKDLMEAEYGADYVTLVDAGDFAQGGTVGALTQGEAIIEVMNAVGYDIITLGNHEYDYQIPQMFVLMDMLESIVVSSNFIDLATGESVYEAYTIVSYGDIDVAYVGITTPESYTKTTPAYFQDEDGNFIYGFCEGNDGQDLYDNIQASVDAAIDEGADYVIAVAHLGIEDEADPWRSTDVIANTTGIDVMLDGHSHTVVDAEEVLNLDGETVLLSQTGTKFEYLGKVVIDGETGEISSELISADDFTDKSDSVQAVVDAINEEQAVLVEQIVATTDVALTTVDPITGERIVRSQETNMGDLIADAYRSVIGADIALINGGGIRADIAAGDITYGDIIDVNPWGNDIVSVLATGATILDALEMGAINTPSESGGFLQVSGLTYTIDTTIPSSVTTDDMGNFVSVDGDYRVTDVMIGDEALDLEKVYVVASHNYLLLSGGDGMSMFADCQLDKDKFMVDNEGLIAYIVDTLGGVVGEDYANPYGQGRITILTEVAEEEAEVEETEPEAQVEVEEPETTEPEVTEPEAETTEITYIVVAGDSLWAIAKAQLGAGTRWGEIQELNGIENVLLLQIGQELKLPG